MVSSLPADKRGRLLIAFRLTTPKAMSSVTVTWGRAEMRICRNGRLETAQQ
jgi:hypothetical protein